MSAERGKAGSMQDRVKDSGMGWWDWRWQLGTAVLVGNLAGLGAACSVLATARSDLVFLAGGVQKSPAEGGDVPDGLSARAVPSHALRDGCLHARDRHAG